MDQTRTVSAQVKIPFSWVHPKVALKTSVKFGYAGLYASVDLKKDTTVIMWGGRIVTEEELMSMPPEEDAYSLQLDEGLFQVPIIAHVREAADYSNHSCNPNAGFSSPITLVLMRDVKAGEEITFDYAMCESNDKHGEFNCMCGSSKCRGKFTGNDWKLPEIRQRYKGYFSPYLEKKIKRMEEEEEKEKQKRGQECPYPSASISCELQEYAGEAAPLCVSEKEKNAICA